MMRSLFSGISGLRAHQQLMDVTGNNIANVNTTGFKSGQLVFEDALSQTLRSGGAASTTTGATNPAQVGLGVRLGGTHTDFSQGATQITGRSTDILIQGDGFFVVDLSGRQAFTRAGAFTLDSLGQLSTPDGGLVQGWQGTAGVIDTTAPIGPITIDPSVYRSFSVSSAGVLTGALADGTLQSIAQVAVANFANPNGLTRGGGSIYERTANSGVALIGVPGANGTGVMVGAAIEMSNVDLAQEMTDLIIAQRGFQANSKVISTSDELLQDLMNLKR